MRKSHEETTRIKQELSQLNEQINLPDELLKAINDEISPEYILREKRSQAKTHLTILTTIAAFSSSLLPYPLDHFTSLVCIILAVPILYKLISYSLTGDKKKRKEKIFQLIGLISYCVSIITISFFIFAAFAAFFTNFKEDRIMFSIFSGVSFGASIFLLASGCKFTQKVYGNYSLKTIKISVLNIFK
ncbi:MAG: hypothetical protein WA081_01805 [Desulfosalsimonadaceae bacterium]